MVLNYILVGCPRLRPTVMLMLACPGQGLNTVLQISVDGWLLVDVSWFWGGRGGRKCSLAQALDSSRIVIWAWTDAHTHTHTPDATNLTVLNSEQFLIWKCLARPKRTHKYHKSKLYFQVPAGKYPMNNKLTVKLWDSKEATESSFSSEPQHCRR